MMLVSNMLTIGRSSTSIQMTGFDPRLPWSWNVHDGVRTKSPVCIAVRSPSTAV
jgi:hypothetical protein